jgi:shikimate 5-dehydrogenase
MKIAGNSFIVTGGAGGIGGAVATELVSRGATVTLFDVIPEDKGAEFAKTVSADKAFYVKVDMYELLRVSLLWGSCKADLHELPPLAPTRRTPRRPSLLLWPSLETSRYNFSLRPSRLLR